MSIQIEFNKIYKCKKVHKNGASIHVVSGEIKILVTNIVAKDKKNNIILPKKEEMTKTDDILKEGLHVFNGLPEWICFEGTGEAWIKNGIDLAITESAIEEENASY